MKNNFLALTIVFLSSSLTLAGGSSDPGTPVLDESVLVQSEKMGQISTTIADLGALTPLTAHHSDFVNLIAFYEQPLNPILEAMVVDMKALGSDTRNIRLNDKERHNTVIGYGSNLAAMNAEQKQLIAERGSEVRNLPQDARVDIRMGYTLSKQTTATLRTSSLTCSNRIVASFRYSVQEPTGILKDLVFETRPQGGMSAEISYAQVPLERELAVTIAKCLNQLK